MATMANFSEQREQDYLEARRQIGEAAARLSGLDERASANGHPIDRQSILTEASDPATAAHRLLEHEPDRRDLHEVVTEWLTAHEEAARIWATLPPATQMRLSQPSEE